MRWGLERFGRSDRWHVRRGSVEVPVDSGARLAAGPDQIPEPTLALHVIDQLARLGLFPLASKVVIIYIYVETQRAQFLIVEVFDDLQAQIRELLSG